MEPVTLFLNAIKLARKQSYKNLTVFPLLAPDGDKPDYLTLEQALDRGLCPDYRDGSGRQRS